MALLFSVFFYMVICSWAIYKRKMIYQIREGKRDTLFLFFSFGMLVLLACFRGLYVGNDTYSYYALFQYYSGQANVHQMSIAKILWMDNLEIGYRALNYFFGKYMRNYQLFISVLAIVSYGIMARFVKRYSSNLALSSILVFLMLFGVYMNLLRQVLAMSVVLLSFDFLNKNKKTAFVIGVLLATILFHRTAFIALSILPMSQIKSRKSLLWIAAGIVAIIVQLGQIPVFISLLGITTRYTEVSSGIGIVFAIIRSLIILIFAWYLKTGTWGNGDNSSIGRVCANETMLNPTIADNLISWIPFVCFIISIGALGLPVAIRFEYYYIILLVVLIPRMITTSKRKYSSIHIVVSFLILMLLIYNAGIILFRPEWVTEFSYTFFWSD